MKRLTLVVSLLSIFSTLLAIAPSQVQAQYRGPFTEVCENAGEGGGGTVVCQNQNNKKNPLIGKDGVLMSAINIIAWIIGVASVIIIIISGLKYITSAGDPKQIASAKDTLLYAIIGIIIFVFAQAILNFVVARL